MSAHRLSVAVLFVNRAKTARGRCSCGESVELTNAGHRDVRLWHEQHVAETDREIPPVTTRGES